MVLRPKNALSHTKRHGSFQILRIITIRIVGIVIISQVNWINSPT